MECSNTIAELIISVVQITSVVVSFVYFEWWVALLLVVACFGGFSLFVRYILKLEPVKSNDKMLLSDDFFKRQLILVSIELDNFNAEAIYTKLSTLAFGKIQKLSSHLVYKFFNFYWEKSPKPRDQIIKERLVIKKAISREELESIYVSELEKNLDLSFSPIEFHIYPLKNERDRGIIILKSDHSFTDGMAILSLFCCLTEDFNEKYFPEIMRKRVSSIWGKILDFILFIFFGVFVLLYIIITTKSSFKFSENKRSEKVSVSKKLQLDLTEIKQASKSLNISINDIFLASLLSSIKKFKYQEKKITLMVPVGLSPIPKSINDVHIANYVSGAISKMTLINDPVSDLETYKTDIKHLLRQVLFVRILDYAVYLLSLVFPFNVFKEIAMGTLKEIDFCCTNLPGPTKVITIEGQSIVDVEGFTSGGYLQGIFVIVSYNNKVTLRGIVDKSQEIDVEFISKNLETTLKSLIQSTKNN